MNLALNLVKPLLNFVKFQWIVKSLFYLRTPILSHCCLSFGEIHSRGYIQNMWTHPQQGSLSFWKEWAGNQKTGRETKWVKWTGLIRNAMAALATESKYFSSALVFDQEEAKANHSPSCQSQFNSRLQVYSSIFSLLVDSHFSFRVPNSAKIDKSTQKFELLQKLEWTLPA